MKNNLKIVTVKRDVNVLIVSSALGHQSQHSALELQVCKMIVDTRT